MSTGSPVEPSTAAVRFGKRSDGRFAQRFDSPGDSAGRGGWRVEGMGDSVAG